MARQAFTFLDSSDGDIEFNAAQVALLLANATSPVALVGSDFSGATIGATTPPNSTVAALHVDTGTKTATATAGAATLNKMSGVITTESLTTAAGSSYALTLTNSDIAAGDIVMASVAPDTDTNGTPCITTCAVSAGQVIISVKNIHVSAAFNGLLYISFLVLKV